MIICDDGYPITGRCHKYRNAFKRWPVVKASGQGVVIIHHLPFSAYTFQQVRRNL